VATAAGVGGAALATRKQARRLAVHWLRLASGDGASSDYLCQEARAGAARRTPGA